MSCTGAWSSSFPLIPRIAADGWSITTLVRDLGVAYASRCAGHAPDWTPLAVQYVDYTLWQRAQLGDLADADSRIAAQLAYWQDVLAGLPELPSLVHQSELAVPYCTAYVVLRPSGLTVPSTVAVVAPVEETSEVATLGATAATAAAG